MLLSTAPSSTFAPGLSDPRVMPPAGDPVALLAALAGRSELDFAGYRTASLLRRIDDRMRRLRVPTYDAYRRLLDADPAEYGRLADHVPVHVTEFFRDPAAWDYLRRTALPQRLVGRDREPLRVWCAGCATGEEAYSLAACFAELLGTDRLSGRVRIIATDLSELAVARARPGRYPAAALGGVPEELRDAGFRRDEGGTFTVRPSLRSAVTFCRHDLLRDPPFSDLDFISCRNTLMYFTRDAQDRLLGRFHDVLAGAGLLLLGRPESAYSHRQRFAPLAPSHQLYRKVAAVRPSTTDALPYAA